MESKISEFKPCPFCGKAPEVETIGSCVEIWCCCKVSIQKSDYLTIDERETWDQQRFMFSSAVEKKVLLEAAKQWNVRYLETELTEARAEIERKDKLIEQVADLCHCAGLVNLSETETLKAIRQLTCRLWDKKTEKADVLAALEAAERGE